MSAEAMPTLTLVKKGNRVWFYQSNTDETVHGTIMTKSLHPNGKPQKAELEEVRDALKAGPHGLFPAIENLVVSDESES